MIITQLNSNESNILYGFRTTITYDVLEDGTKTLEVEVVHGDYLKSVTYYLKYYDYLNVADIVESQMRLIIEEIEDSI